jgi:hypothetical protein
MPRFPLFQTSPSCPRSLSFLVQSQSRRHRSKPPPCRCRLRGDPVSRLEVRNLPWPLHFPSLTLCHAQLLVGVPSAAAEPPHRGPSPSGAPTLVQPPPLCSPHPPSPSQASPATLRPQNPTSFGFGEFLAVDKSDATSGGRGRTPKSATRSLPFTLDPAVGS